jgi:hypothetical protein
VRLAAVLWAIDRGTALVVRARFPEAAARVYSLGELAGRPRDIPDPFRMQIGAWMTYAREIESMLEAALPRMLELLPETTTDDRPTTNDQRPTTNDEANPKSGALGRIGYPAGVNPKSEDERAAAATRIGQLLQVAAQMPGVVDWGAARARIEADLAQVAAAPRDAGDLVAAYAGLLHAALALLPPSPTAGQLAALQRAVARLDAPIGQADINELSARVALLPSMP